MRQSATDRRDNRLRPRPSVRMAHLSAMTMDSFHDHAPIEAAIFGMGGIGRAMATELAADPMISKVHGFSRSAHPVEGVETHAYDPQGSLPDQLKAVAFDNLRLCVVTVGVLHEGENGPEKALKDIDDAWFLRVMRTNTLLPMLIGQAIAPLMPRHGRTLFGALSARVGSISDNRLGGWYSYRISKAALNMGLRTMSIETQRRNDEAIVVGLHPGTVDTELSAPFQTRVPEKKLFSPRYSAAHLLEVLDGLRPDQSGQCYDYAGKLIDP